MKSITGAVNAARLYRDQEPATLLQEEFRVEADDTERFVSV